MASAHPWSFRFFRFAGIQVFVHASWFIVAWIEISSRSREYTSVVWNIAEYLGLFLIVLIHEFGHVLACRQTGGVSNEILLWPLGGVALVSPPQRASAQLWTIAAGPLVNVVLYPLLMLATTWLDASEWGARSPDLVRLTFTLWTINKWLLIFNLLPIYPLDGGQIVRSLLWFGIGRARSLQVAATIGLIGIVALAGYRAWTQPGDWIWTAVLAFFLGSQCVAGLRHGKALRELERLPRHDGFACPSCRQPPREGPVWLCPGCGNRFDAFLTRSICPHCQAALPTIRCIDCGAQHSVLAWENTPTAAADISPITDR
jgi:Zn-dependent protease